MFNLLVVSEKQRQKRGKEELETGGRNKDT